MNHLPSMFLASALLAPAACAAQAEEWSCPPGDKVGITAVAPGWIAFNTLMYPYQAPVLVLDSMENSTHGPAAVCKYRVDKGNLVSMNRLAKCEHGRGTWKTAGPKSTCEGRNASDCSLLCTPVAEALKDRELARSGSAVALDPVEVAS